MKKGLQVILAILSLLPISIGLLGITPLLIIWQSQIPRRQHD